MKRFLFLIIWNLGCLVGWAAKWVEKAGDKLIIWGIKLQNK